MADKSYIYYPELPESYLKETLNYEGEYSNKPKDRGGETNRGITIGTLNAAIKQGLVPSTVTIKSLTTDLESVRKIYNVNYYKKSHAPVMPHPLAFVHWDASVHHGIGGGMKLLQKTLNTLGAILTVDGGYGPLTKAALDKCLYCHAVSLIVERQLKERENRFYDIVREDPTQQGFLQGWLNRVAKIRTWVEKNK